MTIRSQKWITLAGVWFAAMTAGVLVPSTVRAEGGHFEFTGGTSSTLTFNSSSTGTGSYGLFSATVNAGMSYMFGAGIELGIEPSVSYINSPAAGLTSLTLTAVFGPTINFVFADDVRDSVYLFLGAGFTNTSVTVAGIAASTMGVSYAAHLGKRFSISADISYKPQVGIQGSFNNGGAPDIVFTPLQFTFFP